jgi:putative serine protease PepD
MADAPSPKTRSRGPAAGRLWSGELAPEAPPPPPPAPPTDAAPTRERVIFRDPAPAGAAGGRTLPVAGDDAPAEPDRERRALRRGLAGGALSGLAVALATLAIGGAVLDDDEEPGGGAATPPAVVTSAGGRDQSAVSAVYKAASPAVAAIQTNGGSGSGFLTDADGTIVTNAHVVGDATVVRVRFGDDGRTLTGRVVGSDTSTDLAVVKVDRDAVAGIRPLQFADSSKVEVGDLAVAIGNPLGLPQTATAGIVSGLQRQITAPNGFSINQVIQTDAPINPGNSGGPLLDEHARVIGVNSQIATAGAGGGNIGIGFAVPSNTAKEVVPQLERGETIKRPWLGVSTSPAPGGGAVVREVTPGSPADRAGIEPGDVITRVDGRRVDEPDDVADAVAARQVGDRITVELRSGRDVDVTLGNRPR